MERQGVQKVDFKFCLQWHSYDFENDGPRLFVVCMSSYVFVCLRMSWSYVFVVCGCAQEVRLRLCTLTAARAWHAA